MGGERWWGVIAGVLLCVCLLSAGLSPVAAQTTGEVDVSTLYETDAIDGSQQVRDVVRTEDGGLIALVLTNQGRETLVVKLDNTGSVVGEESVSGRLESISRVDTDAYAAAGARGEVAILTRINEEGWIEWTERYGGDELDVGFDAVSAPHGDTYLLASTESFENDTAYDTANLWVLRIDDEGEVRWDRLLEHEEWTAFPKGERLADGSLIATIQTDRSVGGEEADGQQAVSAVRLAPDGDTEWRTRIDGANDPPGSQRTLDVVPAHDDGVLLAGGSNSGTSDGDDFEMWAARLGADGEVDWQRQYGADFRSVATSAVRTSEGYMLVGASFDQRRGQEVSAAQLTQIDREGDEQYTALMHRSERTRERAAAVDWVGEGRLAIGGTTARADGDGSTISEGWVREVTTLPSGVDPGPSVWESQHSDAEQNGEGWSVEDSSADIMLLGATAVSILLLFVPYGGRRLRRWR